MWLDYHYQTDQREQFYILLTQLFQGQTCWQILFCLRWWNWGVHQGPELTKWVGVLDFLYNKEKE